MTVRIMIERVDGIRRANTRAGPTGKPNIGTLQGAFPQERSAKALIDANPHVPGVEIEPCALPFDFEWNTVSLTIFEHPAGFED